VVLAVGCFAQVVMGALLSAAAGIAPTVQAEYELSLSQIGVVLAAFQAGATLTLLVWGILADRVGERLVIGVGMTSAGLSLILAGQASTEFTFVVALVVAGMSAASINAASGRAVMNWFGPGERGLALGIRQTAGMVGMASGAATLPAIAEAGGLAAAMTSLAAAAIAAAVVALVWLREAVDHESDPAVVTNVLDPLRDRRIWRITLGSAALVLPQLALLSFVVLFLHEERGFSPTGAGYVMAAMALGGALSRIVLGIWSDRVGKRLMPLRRITVALAAALALTSAALAGPDAVLVAALIVAGTLSMGWNGLSFAAVAELAGRRRSGVALGFQQTILGVMGVLTPIFFAAVVAAFSWRTGFALLPLFPILAYPFFLLRAPTRVLQKFGH
jgi:sugar phosphate permease